MIEDKLLRSLGDQLGRFIGDAALREDMQKSLETVTQGAFARLDLVTREQFDAQIELLQQAREQIERLEEELTRAQQRLTELERDRA
ncbi:MAG: accessory factor UbiK family protein [Pseudomonadales bacterium]|jgi:BMFP domain-containing protein YqiC|nr:accessory factor UbiK family protein [Pseudomonadales bacterium]MCP5336125.1 accessory factor UbiK family protein [Pseudomonadales bacterium]